MRQLHLAAFMIAGPVAHSHALWRHPRSRFDFLRPEAYQQIAQVLERGKFDLLFFADRLAVSESYGHSFEVGVRYGDQDAVRLDPVPLLAAIALTTQNLGLGATVSTTYAHPYSVARSFATLDHLTHGRVAWNIVTSVNDGEAQNFGVKTHLEHDQRYDRADEFLDVACQLWESWQPDALVLDRERGILADPDKVNYIHHQGQWFQSRGPLNVPSGPQGKPVLIQAGASGRGREFAARWAEVVFAIQPTLSQAQQFYSDLKGRVQARGRSPEQCKILLGVMPFVGETEAIARQKQAEHNNLVNPLVGLSTLSNHLNYDFSQHPLDQPLEELDIQGMRGIWDLVQHLSAEGTTLAEIGQRYGASVLIPQIVGTPTQIADQLEAFFQADACDGFMISPAYLPGAFTDFVETVVPELQRRGLFRQTYSGNTLRDHLALPRASGAELSASELFAPEFYTPGVSV
ncbi:LLM class flavin-dependent oxidoreductase [Nodosilinea sp. FACHB-13]|uniref:LLM class flavin-dependent oxidoreductase n=1 Tax=Cyanophyceae TaxID=3028117 RepID=UPI00168647FC|nr:LLM class flavin-dependent oxidoreductase [Nodosilinea sp. FACHB-13]MBD2108234.1 LLM class flavin-dependent oxidoreductase [Nodosilinea sp. FACHB-13]